MTVVPFPRLRHDLDDVAGVPARGSFLAPDGTAGRFRGSYRLERLLREHGLLVAAGVFTGRLERADGTVVAPVSRRQSAAAVLCPGQPAELRLGPLDVNLLGLFVTVSELVVPLPAGPAQEGR